MRTNWIIISLISAGLLASSVAAAGEQTVLKDRAARDSYSLGYQFGRNLTGQGVEIDKEALVAAVRDGLDGRKPVLSEAEIIDNVKALRRRALAFQEQRGKEQSAKNLEEAKAFLEANRKKTGVITLPSGLQYRVISEGEGAGPKATDGVRIRYRGTLVDGTEFDTMADLGDGTVPVIPVAGANKGWTEALQLMKPGAKWQLFVPPQLGYGDRPYGRVPANSVLVYELELLSVVDRSAADAASGHVSAAGTRGSKRPEPAQEHKD